MIPVSGGLHTSNELFAAGAFVLTIRKLFDMEQILIHLSKKYIYKFFRIVSNKLPLLSFITRKMLEIINNRKKNSIQELCNTV